MVLAKSKNAVGLGNALMNDRFGKGKGADRKKVSTGIQRTGPSGETYVTNAPKEASWVKMRSVTEQAALDEFLSTAELAGTDFTAEKMNNVKIMHSDQRNPYLLSATEERSAIRKQNANKNRLTVPRRPKWDETTTPQQLDLKERESLLEWRRGLADLQENQDLLMTPFERNLEVWRQLWRVIERSDLVVQIVDARNPLLFRSEDLETYVKQVDPRKNNLLLVNKADMMTLKQREVWAEYFEQAGINYKFFSASLAKELNDARLLDEVDDDREELDMGKRGEAKDYEKESDEDDEDDQTGVEQAYNTKEDQKNNITDGDALANEANKITIQDNRDSDAGWTDEESSLTDEPPRTRILTVDELEALFLEHAPNALPNPPVNDSDNNEHSTATAQQTSRKITIGLVGYPNVGKSSTINALIGAKKVSVSSTPGKTKHFQTIHLSPSVILCDCPGLVFPSFATTKAELVCNGILPIDQLREFTGPAGLVAQRIPQSFFEGIYGVKVKTRPIEEGGTGIPTASEVLSAYAKARGFATTGQGQPDESRAARYVLKDYVKGKLLYCHPPPTDPPTEGQEFNKELYDERHLPQKWKGPLKDAELLNDDQSLIADSTDVVGGGVPVQGAKSTRLDKTFFGPGQGGVRQMTMPFHHRYSEQGAADMEASVAGGRQLSGRKQRTMVALEKNVDPSEVRLGNGKKHFKAGKKRVRVPVGGEDD
ncbi:hypothetical protein MMC25_000541 [Agyrium rufum]|nr:hypothetical protein [Agyrium rufum]